VANFGWWVVSAALVVAFVAVAVAFALWRRMAETEAERIGGLRTALDETARRERALEAENGWLRTILTALDDAVIVVGPGQEILSVNDAALTLFPTSFATVRGRSVIELTGDHEIADLVRRCHPSGVRQERTIDHSGSGRSLRIIAVPAGTAGNALLLARDITQLQHLQTVRRELVANVSHELRTPLASIKLYVETLLDGGLEVPGMAEDRLNKIIREVDELTQLVRELLELARLESGRDQPDLAPLDVAAIACSAVERLEAQAERAGIALTVAVPTGRTTVRGDRRMLEGALVNLIHNAVKFTPSGGRVTVGATAEADGQVALWVQDSGVGIPAEHLPRLFERFYKEDPARSGGGTGLGLAIVKHVALVHGGTVAVSSTMGVGSRFAMTLPVATETSRISGAAHVA
jgi:two-component system phosphate regulon sensor histidine kinase PhoR